MKEPATRSAISRRNFLMSSAALAAVGGVTARPTARGEEDGPFRPGCVIDCHAHLHHRSRSSWEEADRKLIDAADRLKIDLLCCSILTPRRPATADGFRECNRWLADAMKRYPDRVLGYAYVNPGYTREAIDEIRRCVEDRGFIGIKLYNEYRCTDPVVFPIVELAIELGVPILQHAGHINYFLEDQAHISDGGRIAELSRRYPEAKLICAHACGGGDWEWTIKALRSAPGVSLDLSGSVLDAGVVELAVRVLGVERLLFGCDMSMTASVGRIRGANLSETDRAKIQGGNMMRLLGRQPT